LGFVPGCRCRQEFGGPSDGKWDFVYNAANIHVGMQGTWQFMSTRLLTRLESRHTITDDLESHYFVLMWTALHWIKHNRPGDPSIGMEHIFDHQWPLANGIVKGGAGKVEMYGSRDSQLCDVEFACEPFNELFWDLWMLFSEYLEQRREASRKRDLGPGEYSRQESNVERSEL